jgi:hypothetical protein
MNFRTVVIFAIVAVVGAGVIAKFVVTSPDAWFREKEVEIGTQVDLFACVFPVFSRPSKLNLSNAKYESTLPMVHFDLRVDASADVIPGYVVALGPRKIRISAGAPGVAPSNQILRLVDDALVEIADQIISSCSGSTSIKQ